MIEEQQSQRRGHMTQSVRVAFWDGIDDWFHDASADNKFAFHQPGPCMLQAQEMSMWRAGRVCPTIRGGSETSRTAGVRLMGASRLGPAEAAWDRLRPAEALEALEAG